MGFAVTAWATQRNSGRGWQRLTDLNSPQILKFAAGVSEPLTEQLHPPASQGDVAQNQLGQIRVGAQSRTELFTVGIWQKVLLGATGRKDRTKSSFTSRLANGHAWGLHVTSQFMKYFVIFILSSERPCVTCPRGRSPVDRK